jgi:hypothetical protein
MPLLQPLDQLGDLAFVQTLIARFAIHMLE